MFYHFLNMLNSKHVLSVLPFGPSDKIPRRNLQKKNLEKSLNCEYIVNYATKNMRYNLVEKSPENWLKLPHLVIQAKDIWFYVYRVLNKTR